MFHNNCSITNILKCTLQSIRKRLFSGRKPLTVYTGPIPQLYGSFLHIFQLRSFQIIILQTSQLLLCERQQALYGMKSTLCKQRFRVAH